MNLADLTSGTSFGVMMAVVGTTTAITALVKLRKKYKPGKKQQQRHNQVAGIYDASPSPDIILGSFRPQDRGLSSLSTEAQENMPFRPMAAEAMLNQSMAARVDAAMGLDEIAQSKPGKGVPEYSSWGYPMIEEPASNKKSGKVDQPTRLDAGSYSSSDSSSDSSSSSCSGGGD